MTERSEVSITVDGTGGGVQQGYKRIEQYPMYGGKSCEETDGYFQERACGIQSCESLEGADLINTLSSSILNIYYPSTNHVNSKTFIYSDSFMSEHRNALQYIGNIYT